MNALKLAKVKDELFAMDDYKGFDRLCELWNEYASESESDSMIYDSIEALQEIAEFDSLELARKVFFGDVQNWGDKVALDGYANLVSVWNVDNSPIRVHDLAEWLIETDHEFVDTLDEE